jgi:hypothetical protein
MKPVLKFMSKLVVGVSFALVFSSISLAAQIVGQSTGQIRGGIFTVGHDGATTTVTAAPTPAGCPVSLRAQHMADGELVQVRSSHPAGIGQWLHLTLANHRDSEIVKATVTIHGLSNKARITQSGVSYGLSDDSSDVVRTLTVQFSAASPGSVAGDVRVPGMTAVQRIDLDSVAYADGMVQSFAGRQVCHVTPDGFMLVAGR